MKYIFILGSIYFFIGCNSTSKRNQSVNLLQPSIEQKLDSLKWLFYALNHSGKMEETNKLSTKIYPVEFDISFIDTIVRKDTLFVTARFVDKDYSGLPTNLEYGYQVRGIGVINGSSYILDFGELTPDFIKYPDSTNKYVYHFDRLFTNYLKSYKGSMSSWLKHEAIRRKIL